MMTETPQYSDAVHKVLRGLRRDIPTFTEDDYKTAPKSGRVCIGVKSIYSKPVIRFCPKYGAIYMRKVMGRTIDFLDLDTNTVIQSHQKNAYDGFWNVYEVPCTHSQSKECQLEVNQPETGHSKPHDNLHQTQIKQNMDPSQAKSKHGEQQQDVRLSKVNHARRRRIDNSSKTKNKYPIREKLSPIPEIQNDDNVDTIITIAASGESDISNKSLYSSSGQIKTIQNLVKCEVKYESKQINNPLNINDLHTSLDPLQHYPIRTKLSLLSIAKLSLLSTPRLSLFLLPTLKLSMLPTIRLSQNEYPTSLMTTRKSVNSSSSVRILQISWASKSAIENSSKIMSSIIWNANKAATDEMRGVHSYLEATLENVEQNIRQDVESENNTLLEDSINDVSINVCDDQHPIKPAELDICAKSEHDSSFTETRDSKKTTLTTDLYSVSNNDIEDTGKLLRDDSTDGNNTQFFTAPGEESITATFNLLARQTSVKQKQGPEVEPGNATTIKDSITDAHKVADENCESMINSISLTNKDILISSDSAIGILGIYASGQQHYNVDCVSILKDGHDNNDDDGDAAAAAAAADDDDDDSSMSGLFGVFTRDC